MSKIIFDSNIIKFISLFESITQARIKDCIPEDNSLLFIVDEGEAGKAIGKGGVNIRKLSGILKKQLRVVEYNSDVTKFIRNLIYPLKADMIEKLDDSVVIRAQDRKLKGQVYGRERTNLKKISDIVSRYFDVEVKVE